MATADLNPNQDSYYTEWFGYPDDVDHYTNIDEGSTPNTADYINAVGTPNKLETYFMESVEGVVEVTQIDVKVYYMYSELVAPLDPVVTVDISFDNGASWEGEKTMPTKNPAGWQTFSWTGLSKTQEELNNLNVRFNSGALGSSNGCAPIYDSIIIYTMYATVTYTTGWTHKFLGVANINKISGVLKTNISKVKGK